MTQACRGRGAALVPSDAVLAVAGRAFTWLGGQAVSAAGGAQWCDLATPSDDLYGGTAGVLLACAEATAAGLDVSAVARLARGRLLHLAQHPDAAGLPDDGCFTGWSGIALALASWSRAADDQDAAAAAQTVAAAIADRVRREPPSADRYLDVIFGDAGMLLALHDTPGHATQDAVGRLADRLAGAVQRSADGPQWPMRAGDDYLMPGFSHGTAGVGYALLQAGRRLGRPELLRLAVTAAGTLENLGTTPAGWRLALTRPGYPNRPPVNYGWCHGVAGTVQLFAGLEMLDPRWHRVVRTCLRALHDSGIPHRRYPGFWDNVACCCGTAGVGRVLLRRYDATGEPALLRWAARLAADVLHRRIDDREATTWCNTEHTRTPPDLPPEPGFMQGTAGVAAWLAGLGARMAGTRPEPVGPAWV